MGKVYLKLYWDIKDSPGAKDFMQFQMEGDAESGEHNALVWAMRILAERFNIVMATEPEQVVARKKKGDK